MAILGSLHLCFQNYLLKQEASKLSNVTTLKLPASDSSLAEAVQWDTDRHSNTRVDDM